MKHEKIKHVDEAINENMLGKIYLPSSYYSSLDFIYKYVKEVIIPDISSVKKSFFKKYFSNIEDHRFARNTAIKNNHLYNNIYPSAGIILNQDFSGAGYRTRMHQSNYFNVTLPERVLPFIFHENNITIYLNSNVYKYNANIIAKFDTSFSASEFVSKIHNNIHINKHYVPKHSFLRYRLDDSIYMLLRKMYNSEYEDDLKFLDFLNRNSTFKIIREFDKATGNVSYFYLLPIQPLILVQTPSFNENNAPGLRETIVNITVDIEIELPNALYFTAPFYLLKKFNVKYFDGIIFDDKDDPIIQKEIKEQNKDLSHGVSVLKNDQNDNILVTMPKIDEERIAKIHKKELKYEASLIIENPSEVLIIEDKNILSFIKENMKSDDPELYILKIFDEDGMELIPKNFELFEDCIRISIEEIIADTVCTLQIYG